MAKRKRKAIKPKGFVVPEWMERYRTVINSGGFSVETMMDDKTDYQVNIYRAMISVGVMEQVGLLTRLHNAHRLGW